MSWPFVSTLVLSPLLAAVFAFSFIRKQTHAPASLVLRDQLAVAPRLWRSIGVLELLGALGLLGGLVVPALGVAAAVGAALLMLGAVLAHLRHRVFGSSIVAPVVFLVIAVVVSALNLDLAQEWTWPASWPLSPAPASL